jgi:hypothetical protein
MYQVWSKSIEGCYGRTDGSITISLRNFVGEVIKIGSHMSVVSLYCKTRKYLCSDEHSEEEHNHV